MLNAVARRFFSFLDTTVSTGRTLTRASLGARSGSDRWVEFSSRSWTSDLALSRQFLDRVQGAKWGATRWGADWVEGQEPLLHWKGVPNIKDPYDFTLVPLLLWELKPVTVIELGSYMGGSAIWMADLLEAMGVDCRIYSFDIDVNRIRVRHPKVEFLQADCSQPSSLIGPWIDAPHPWLLIEDAHVNTLAVLKEFHPHLAPGDYWIVEDTAFILDKYRALEAFMDQHGQQYRVDTRYTDLFGYNATFSFNGYLKRV